MGMTPKEDQVLIHLEVRIPESFRMMMSSENLNLHNVNTYFICC